MKQRHLSLAAEQRAELVRIRDHDRRPYMRERAGALLKIADGMAAHAVAHHGLLRHRRPATVYDWLDRYARDGTIHPRPATRRAFPPRELRTGGGA